MTKISNQYSLTNVLTADTTNGRVGIGTASPAYALQVSAATGTNVTPQINAVNTTTNGYGILRLTGASRGGIIDFYDNATAQTSISGQGGVLSFYTNGDSSGTAKVTITSAGNVGIGTSSPTSKLSVIGGIDSTSYYVLNKNGTDSLSTSFYQQDTLSTTAYAINMQMGNTGGFNFWTYNGSWNERMRITSGGTLQIKNSTADLSLEIFYNGTTSTGGIGSDANNFIIGGQTGKGLTFCTNNLGQEKMRITVGGNVGIGVSNPTYKLDVNGEIVTRGSATAAYSYEDRNNTSIVYTMYGYAGYTNFYNGGNRAQINMSNGVYTALSDVNKKKDFEQSNIGLNEVLQLKPTLYRLKESEELSPKELGFIAQEVKEFIPQAYVETGEGDNAFIGLNQMPLIAALTKAIQQQQTQINELKALINA